MVCLMLSVRKRKDGEQKMLVDELKELITALSENVSMRIEMLNTDRVEGCLSDTIVCNLASIFIIL